MMWKKKRKITDTHCSATSKGSKVNAPEATQTGEDLNECYGN
jgi:hypothetical protein